MYKCNNCDSRFHTPQRFEFDPLDIQSVNTPKYANGCPDCDSDDIEYVDRFEGLTLEEWNG
jgi:hypothetical protein